MFDLFKRKSKCADWLRLESALYSDEVFYCVDDKRKYRIIAISARSNLNKINISVGRLGYLGSHCFEVTNHEFRNKFKKVVRLNGN